MLKEWFVVRQRLHRDDGVYPGPVRRLFGDWLKYDGKRVSGLWWVEGGDGHVYGFGLRKYYDPIWLDDEEERVVRIFFYGHKYGPRAADAKRSFHGAVRSPWGGSWKEDLHGNHWELNCLESELGWAVRWFIEAQRDGLKADPRVDCVGELGTTIRDGKGLYMWTNAARIAQDEREAKKRARRRPELHAPQN